MEPEDIEDIDRCIRSYDLDASLGSLYAAADRESSSYHDYGADTFSSSSRDISGVWGNPETYSHHAEPLVGLYDHAIPELLLEPAGFEQREPPRFSCPDCPAFFRLETDLEPHRQDAHPPEMRQDSPRPYQVSQNNQIWNHQCDACGASFKRRPDLKRHQDFIHKARSLPKFHCDYQRCGRSSDGFNRKDHYRDHLRNYHKEPIKRRAAGENDGSNSLVSPPGSKHNWRRCGQCLERIESKEGSNCWRCDTRARSRSPGRRSSRAA